MVLGPSHQGLEHSFHLRIYLVFLIKIVLRVKQVMLYNKLSSFESLAQSAIVLLDYL